MKIILFGIGTIGAAVKATLQASGHEVRTLSRTPGADLLADLHIRGEPSCSSPTSRPLRTPRFEPKSPGGSADPSCRRASAARISSPTAATYCIGSWRSSAFAATPTLIPVKAGDRVKTDHRDAEKLARSPRAGDLTSVWAPDAEHEGLRDLAPPASFNAAGLEFRTCCRQRVPPGWPPARRSAPPDTAASPCASDSRKWTVSEDWCSRGRARGFAS